MHVSGLPPKREIFWAEPTRKINEDVSDAGDEAPLVNMTLHVKGGSKFVKKITDKRRRSIKRDITPNTK